MSEINEFISKLYEQVFKESKCFEIYLTEDIRYKSSYLYC